TIVPQATYDKIKDKVIAKQPKKRIPGASGSCCDAGGRDRFHPSVERLHVRKTGGLEHSRHVAADVAYRGFRGSRVARLHRHGDAAVGLHHSLQLADRLELVWPELIGIDGEGLIERRVAE